MWNYVKITEFNVQTVCNVKGLIMYHAAFFTSIQLYLTLKLHNFTVAPNHI